jgi:hypothetical protein
MELAQPARKATLHELTLVRSEHDAGILGNHVSDEVELGIRKLRTIVRNSGV